MSKEVTKRVTWVGKSDWELRRFHGDEYSTHRGSTYNSYLVRDKKTVLIDTVWTPYGDEFVHNLKKEIDLDKIDYIIANHGEVDHSGALPHLMKEIPNTPIYCTANCVKSLKGQFHCDWNFVTVKTGDTLNIGDCTLTFVEAPMLHWPDSMFVYMDTENILFSNDAFGQHYASEFLYSHQVDQNELMEESLKYYANILSPLSPLVTKKIEQVLSFNLPLDMICTSHGVIWREDPVFIVKKYLEWADSYKENQITLIYDSMWESTRIMAEAIAKGIASVDSSVTLKLLNTAKTDKSDVITEAFRSRAILVGSPTVGNSYLFSIRGILGLIKAAKIKGKAAASFGSYGWSGEAPTQISAELKDMGFEVFDDGFKTLWKPDDEMIEKLQEYGAEFMKKVVEFEKKIKGDKL